MARKIFRIYCITNKKTGHRYVGFTTKPINQRLRRHHEDAIWCKNRPYPIADAFREFGISSFKICLLATSRNTAAAKKLETLFGNMLNTMYPNGYNLRLGSGRKSCSSLTARRISKAHLSKS